jgi:hypothetical protein
MLKIMRKNTRIIIWCVVIAFALWGAGSLVVGTQELSPYAGEVQGEKIKLRDFEKQKKILKLFLPIEASNLPDSVLTLETFKQIALSQEAKRRGLKVTDVEVRSTIESLLGRGGAGIDAEGYSQWTKSVLNEKPRDFEEALRQTLLAQKLLGQLLKGAGLTSIDPAQKLSDEEKKKIEEKNQEISSKVLFNFYSQAQIQIYLKEQ